MTNNPAAQRYAAHHFGGPGVAPKVIEYYTMRGWQPMWEKGLRLSPETCALIRERGGVMVRVRHRLRTVDVIISRYLGEDVQPPTA